ncbi:MAG: helix-turn-helix transcriptional regulator [Bacteroidetes bacterium]|nr:helix-turn-helix transcriptional regulator [Bacteroidota bacterium]
MSELTFNRIKELLAKRRLRNIDLAEHTNTDERTVSNWCTNRSQPTVSTLFKIADYLEVEAGELLTLKKDLMPVPAKKESVQKPESSKKPAARKAAPKKAATRGRRPKAS